MPVPAMTTAAVRPGEASWHSSTRAASASLSIRKRARPASASGGRQPTSRGTTSQA